MTLQDLQTSNGKFTIAAFDHRSSLAEKLGINVNTEDGIGQFMQLKRLFMETFSPFCSAVLTDPIYGKDSVQYKDASSGLLMSLEESGYDTDKGVVPKLVEDWGVMGVKGFGGAAKLLLYIHPEEPQAGAKLALVQQLFQECKQAEVPFLLELVLYPVESEEEFKKNWSNLQARLVNAFTDFCDVLKLEYPGLQTTTAGDAAQACQLISQYARVPWIILSRGMEFEPFKKALDISLQHGGSGFAVGRAVWQEIEQFSLNNTHDWAITFMRIKDFLNTKGAQRMRQLGELTDGQASA